jgi:DNA-binding beta-propeller fold protein YncE
MYVRRDLAPQIWDLNVLPVASEAVDVPVITADQLRTNPATQIYAANYNGLPLFNPRAVAVGPNGERVIADTGNHRIVVLDRAGAFLNAFGSHCNLGDPTNTPCQDPDGAGPLALGDGQFYEPWGVAVDAAGAIYVADTWNGRIQVFDSQGNFLRKWGAFATTNGELGDARALRPPRHDDHAGWQPGCGRHGQQARRALYRPSGEFVNQMGGGGVVAGRFEEPTDVKVDPTDGSLLVADAWNQRVQRFSPDLQFLAEFPVPGWAGRDVLQKPGLTVTAAGDIYVTDPATFFVIGFDRSGAVRGAFGGAGSEPTQFGLPNGIAADLAGGLLVVADGGNSRVMEFSELE